MYVVKFKKGWYRCQEYISKLRPGLVKKDTRTVIRVLVPHWSREIICTLKEDHGSPVNSSNTAQ